MTQEEMDRSVAAFKKKREKGTEVVFNTLKLGQKFQFRETERLCLCEVIFKSSDFIRYDKEGWVSRIESTDPNFHKIVEIYD